MNRMPALLIREFREHRNMLLHVPVAVVAIILLLQILALTAVGMGEDGWISINVDLENGEQRTFALGMWYEQMLSRMALMSPFEQREMIEMAYFGVSWPLFGILWFLVFFYLLGTLYDDRRDRSILFWKSMPVSDAMTVASKLIMALIVIPAIYFASILVVYLAFLVTSTLSLGDAPANVVDVIVDPVGVFARWFTIIGYHLVTILWCAPFYAWALLVSAWARSVPFMWAVGVPLFLSAVDALMLTGELGKFLGRHTLPVGYEDEHVMTLGETVVAYGTSWELPVAIGMAAVFIFLTIKLRGRADEI